MGISIWQLVVAMLIVAAVVVTSKGSLVNSETPGSDKGIMVRLGHWIVIAFVANLLNYFYTPVEYYELTPAGVAIASGIAIAAYEISRKAVLKLNLPVALILSIPLVVALDFTVDEFIYIYYSEEAGISAAEEFSYAIRYLFDPPVTTSFVTRAAILVGVAILLLRFQTGSTLPFKVHAQNISVSYGGLVMNSKLNEANRYVLSQALLGGSLFRRQIIASAKDKHNGNPSELGLDFRSLLKACLYFESRENGFRVIFIALTVLLLIGVAQESIGMIGISVAAMVVTQLVKSFQERFNFIPALKSREFYADKFTESFKVSITEEQYPGIVNEEDNVAIYRGFVPFEGAGFEMGGWSFAVDLSRPKDTLGAKSRPERFGIFEIYGALESAVLKLGVPNLSVKDHFFVNGADAAAFSDILPDKFAKPRQKFDSKLSAAYQSKPDGIIRHYKWIKMKDWGNDLINSFFVRYEIQGDNLFLEASKYLLTPVDTRYRKLDRILPLTFMHGIFWFVGSVLKTPVTLVSSWVVGYANVLMVISEALGIPERATKKLIRNSVNYNYGAPLSVRERLSSPNFMHYYQKMDSEMYLKTLERQIIDATVDFLEAHNIDVSEIKERGSTILNSGVFVQGGDVKAQTLAVGKGAKAESKGILSRVKRPAATI